MTTDDKPRPKNEVEKAIAQAEARDEVKAHIEPEVEKVQMETTEKKSVVECGILIRRPPITNWVHEEAQSFVVTKDVFPKLSNFLTEVNWNTISKMQAPEETPDIGFVFTRVKDFAAGRYSTKPSFLRKVANNLSFLVWNSLMACRKVLKTFDRKRLNWELLGSLLVSNMNSAYAALGAIEGASQDSDCAKEVDTAAVEEPPAKKRKKTNKTKSKTVSAESAGDVPLSASATNASVTIATESSDAEKLASQQPIAVQPAHADGK